MEIIKKYMRYGLGACLMGWASFAWAIKIDTLYQGIVPVASQSVEERSRGIAIAFQSVLVKVSGDHLVLSNHPLLQLRAKSAERLLQEYSYGTSTSKSTPFLLIVNFDPEAVNKLLREAKIPIWGETRPLILVLLDYEAEGYPTEILSDDATDPIASALKQDAEQRGLPIIFPVMDMTDIGQISATTVSAMQMQAFDAVSKRYMSDAVLIGRMIQHQQGFTTQWKLSLGQEQWDWTLSGTTTADILAEIVNRVATTLSSKYAVLVTTEANSALTLKVKNIQRGEDLTALLQYLKTQTLVSDVELEEVTGDEVRLNVHLRGDPSLFKQAILVGLKLTPLSSQDALYQWNP